jgi:endonuclease YncB( thermonuclease family)
MARNFVLAFLLLTLAAVNASAATIFGRVIAINDGDVFTVFNLNRPVRIKLLAVDAPESDQVFGDVAKKHLGELVYDKSVLVEYWGIAADGSLVGRVTLNGADIGAQMLRDGVAWFDASNQDHLSAADREIYRQSEEAARTEKRGLWQAESPIAPWEFVRAKTLRRNPTASLNSVLPAAKAIYSGPAPELNNLTLMGAPARPAAAYSERPKSWHELKPAGEQFTAFVPEGGKQLTSSTPHPTGATDITAYVAHDGSTTYMVMWAIGAPTGESEQTVLRRALESFVSGIGRAYENNTNSAFACELQSARRFSSNGFNASDFELPSCTIPGRVRVYTRMVGGKRQLYIGAAFYPQEDANVSRFLNSFTILPSTAKAKRVASR